MASVTPEAGGEMETRFVTCPKAVVPLEGFVVSATFAMTAVPAAMLVDAGVITSDWNVLAADASCGHASNAAANSERVAVDWKLFGKGLMVFRAAHIAKFSCCWQENRRPLLARRRAVILL
jgi:hypothetical protein